MALVSAFRGACTPHITRLLLTICRSRLGGQSCPLAVVSAQRQLGLPLAVRTSGVLTIEQVLLCTHHLVWSSGKEATHITHFSY